MIRGEMINKRETHFLGEVDCIEFGYTYVEISFFYKIMRGFST